MKTIKRGIGIVVLVLFAWFLLGYFYCRFNSREIALAMVQKLCVEQGYDPKKLKDPVVEQGHEGAISYSWDYADTKHHLELLVWFNYWYEPELAIWDYNRKD
jgi:hypothetical protein